MDAAGGAGEARAVSGTASGAGAGAVGRASCGEDGEVDEDDCCRGEGSCCDTGAEASPVSGWPAVAGCSPGGTGDDGDGDCASACDGGGADDGSDPAGRDGDGGGVSDGVSGTGPPPDRGPHTSKRLCRTTPASGRRALVMIKAAAWPKG